MGERRGLPVAAMLICPWPPWVGQDTSWAFYRAAYDRRQAVRGGRRPGPALARMLRGTVKGT